MGDNERLRHFLNWRSGVLQTDGRAIRLRVIRRFGVVNLDNEVGICGNLFGRTCRPNVRAPSGIVGRQDWEIVRTKVAIRGAAIVDRRELSARKTAHACGIKECGHFGYVLHIQVRAPVPSFHQSEHFRRLNEDSYVMHNLFVARMEFDGLKPFIFGALNGYTIVNQFVRPAAPSLCL
jgi:hypothetical protein